MNLQISSKKETPDEVYVIIEISANSTPVKYEVKKENGLLFVDRFLPSTMFYPCNYGYIDHTMELDGDSLDALVLSPYPLFPTSIILCKPVGVLNMSDESGEDSKILLVPNEKISEEYKSINNIKDVSSQLKQKISYFFEHYKDLERKKWTKVENWEDVDQAKEKILISARRYREQNNNEIT